MIMGYFKANTLPVLNWANNMQPSFVPYVIICMHTNAYCMHDFTYLKQE